MSTLSLEFLLTLTQNMEKLQDDHHTGKIHKYLSITIEYSLTGKVKFSMFGNIGNMFDDTPEYIKEESATPEVHHIFDIAEDELTHNSYITLWYRYCNFLRESAQTYSCQFPSYGL